MFNKLKEISITDKIDYILIYLLISISGNAIFGTAALFIIFIFSLIIFIYRKKNIDILFITIAFILAFILALQAIKFDFLPFSTIVGFYIRILLAYFVIKSIGVSFTEKYVQVMKIFAWISLVILVLSIFIPGFMQFLINHFTLIMTGAEEAGGGYGARRYFLGFHTFAISPTDHSGIIRNSGPFWEAGAFGGYLVIALIFHTIKTGKVFDKKIFIIYLAIISTLSTTAFTSVMALIFFYFLANKEYKVLKVPLIILFSTVGIFLFTYLDFLGAKIEQRIELTSNPGVIYTTTSSRFVDAVRDLYAFEGHELIGRGINKKTRLSKIDKQSGYTIRTNGLTDHLVKFGSIFMIISLLLLLFSFYTFNEYYQKLNVLFVFYTVIVIIMLLQSETYFRFPFFWGLLFLYTIHTNINKTKDK